jgi:hypothetical protein
MMYGTSKWRLKQSIRSQLFHGILKHYLLLLFYAFNCTLHKSNNMKKSENDGVCNI